MVNGLPQYEAEVAAVDAAIADLTATQQASSYQPIEGPAEETIVAVPYWGHAPNWARFWTSDLNGRGMWWETEPYFDKQYAIWMNEDEGKRTYATSKPTLRERPAAGSPLGAPS